MTLRVILNRKQVEGKKIPGVSTSVPHPLPFLHQHNPRPQLHKLLHRLPANKQRVKSGGSVRDGPGKSD